MVLWAHHRPPSTHHQRLCDSRISPQTMSQRSLSTCVVPGGRPLLHLLFRNTSRPWVGRPATWKYTHESGWWGIAALVQLPADDHRSIATLRLPSRQGLPSRGEHSMFITPYPFVYLKPILIFTARPYINIDNILCGLSLPRLNIKCWSEGCQ